MLIWLDIDREPGALATETTFIQAGPAGKPGEWSPLRLHIHSWMGTILPHAEYHKILQGAECFTI